MQQNKATPYNVEHKQPKREYEIINEKGDVKLTESRTSEVFFHARDFLSYLRHFEEAANKTTEMLTEEWQENKREELEKLQDMINEIQPVYEEAEKRAKKHHEEQKKQSDIKRLKEMLKDYKGKEKYIKQVWGQFADEMKQEFTDKELATIQKCIKKAKRM